MPFSNNIALLTSGSTQHNIDFRGSTDAVKDALTPDSKDWFILGGGKETQYQSGHTVADKTVSIAIRMLIK